MKKNLFISLSCAAIVLIALNGCGAASKMSDSTIRNAIQESNTNYSKYDLSIQDLSFDSRNYDKQEKTEAVTVTVVAENENTTYTVSYDVLGKLSDKNWRIVSVTPLSEDIKPKNALTYEDVSYFSDDLIKAAQESEFSEACTMYIKDCTIDSDTSSSTASANITLEADTHFFNVSRDCLVFFDYTFDGWKLSDNSISDYNITLNEAALRGTWSKTVPGDYVTLTIDHVDGTSIYATYDDSRGRHINEPYEFVLNKNKITTGGFHGNDYYSEYYLTFAEANYVSNNYYASFHIDPEDNTEDSPQLISCGYYLQKQ